MYSVGDVAQEVITTIRTVFAFDGGEREANRYRMFLESAKQNQIVRKFFLALRAGLMWLILYSTVALFFWFAIWLIAESITKSNQYRGSSLILVYFNILLGAVSLSQTKPLVKVISQACISGAQVLKILKQSSQIDSFSPNGKNLLKLRGSVEFRNVHFGYPNCEWPVLNGIHLLAEPGQTVALVGPSGGGKSAILDLIPRLYDPDQGEVFIDGHNVRQLNVASLRGRIGVVERRPVLFHGSIAENIKMGNQEARMEEIVEAAREASALPFIESLPEKFATMIGQTSLTLAHCRLIAIARALIRKPRILLLHETASCSLESLGKNHICC